MIRQKKFGKKGESTPITVILLVLIALVLIVILWNLIMGLVKKNTETQELQASLMIVNMDIDGVDAANFTEPQYVNITLRRGGGQDILVNRTEIKKYADIVFIIDSTSSMHDEIDAVISTMNNFIDTLNINKINFTIAIVDFKDKPYFYLSYYLQGISSDYAYRVHNFSTTDPNIVSNFTVNQEDIKNKLLYIKNSIAPGSGGDWPESTIEALNASIEMKGFREIANSPTTQYKKIFILLSDSPPHARDCTCDYSGANLKCYRHTLGQTTIASNYEIMYYDNLRGYINLTNQISRHEYYPFMGNHSILWSDYRYNSNYEIVMCNLSKTTPSTDLTDWCNDLSKGLIRITTSPSSSDYFAKLNEDDSIIVYRSDIGNDKLIKMCNLNGIGSNTVNNWCNDPLKGLKTISTNGINSAPIIFQDKVVWHKFIGGGVDIDSNGRVDKGGNSDIYFYSPSLSSNEIKVTNDPNMSLKISQSPYYNEQTPIFNFSSNYPKNPSLFENKIVWQECRNSTGGMHDCNYDIFMCDLSSLLASDIQTACTTSINSGGRLIKITNHIRNQLNPVIEGDLIVWADNRDHASYYSVYLCNISNIPYNNIENHCQSSGLTRVAYNSDTNMNPDVSGDVITWMKGSYGPVYLCNISLRNSESIFDWCRSTTKGLKVIKNSIPYPIPITPSVNGERVVFYEYIYAVSGTPIYLDNTYHYTNSESAKPQYIKNISDYLIFNNISVHYINKPYNIAVPEGTCKNNTDKQMAIDSGGRYYSYDQALEITQISQSLVDEINEYFRKDIYDHINIIFFNDTKNYLLRIEDIPRPLESKKYSIPKQGSLAGNITNITMIEVYMAAYTRESRREVIGPLLSRWVRRS
ncbi:MAG: hypothetical protein WC867_05495 [Candidatus Pacearchaeota archaeon]|jgi:beta propeller repeat protein